MPVPQDLYEGRGGPGKPKTAGSQDFASYDSAGLNRAEANQQRNVQGLQATQMGAASQAQGGQIGHGTFGLLESAAQGNQPSVAQQQLQAGFEQNQRGAQAQMASGRQGAGLQQALGQQAGSQAQAQTNQQMAQLRAGEMAQARGQLADTASVQAQMQQQLNLSNAEMQNVNAQVNAQLASQAQQLQQSLMNESLNRGLSIEDSRVAAQNQVAMHMDKIAYNTWSTALNDATARRGILSGERTMWDEMGMGGWGESISGGLKSVGQGLTDTRDDALAFFKDPISPVVDFTKNVLNVKDPVSASGGGGAASSGYSGGTGQNTQMAAPYGDMESGSEAAPYGASEAAPGGDKTTYGPFEMHPGLGMRKSAVGRSPVLFSGAARYLDERYLPPGTRQTVGDYLWDQVGEKTGDYFRDVIGRRKEEANQLHGGELIESLNRKWALERGEDHVDGRGEPYPWRLGVDGARKAKLMEDDFRRELALSEAIKEREAAADARRAEAPSLHLRDEPVEPPQFPLDFPLPPHYDFDLRDIEEERYSPREEPPPPTTYEDRFRLTPFDSKRLDHDFLKMLEEKEMREKEQRWIESERLQREMFQDLSENLNSPEAIEARERWAEERRKTPRWLRETDEWIYGQYAKHGYDFDSYEPYPENWGGYKRADGTRSPRLKAEDLDALVGKFGINPSLPINIRGKGQEMAPYGDSTLGSERAPYGGSATYLGKGDFGWDQEAGAFKQGIGGGEPSTLPPPKLPSLSSPRSETTISHIGKTDFGQKDETELALEGMHKADTAIGLINAASGGMDSLKSYGMAAGGKALGGYAGGAIGGAVGGPAGAVAGSAIGSTLGGVAGGLAGSAASRSGKRKFDPSSLKAHQMAL